MIVTISREYGAAALAVGHALATRLDATLLAEDDLAEIVAQRLGVPREAVGEPGQSALERGEQILTRLPAATPEIAGSIAPAIDDFDAESRRMFDTVIREAAERGGRQIVIGRLGGVVLGARPDVLRVFLHAPLPWRIDRIVESLHVDREEARREIARVDAARREYARAYKHAWGDASAYDLTIDTSHFDIEGTAELIAAAVAIGHPAQ